MDEDPQEPTQYTPKGHEIPIPSREQVFRDLEKVAKPRKKPANPSNGRTRRTKKK
jgi:hypothetical protein